MTGGCIKAGLIGGNIKRSSSPALHEQEGRALGLGYSYDLIDLDDRAGHSAALPDILADLQRRGFAGCNITHPVKQAVIGLLDTLSPEAEQMGAVNTVRFAPDGTREGHNTDWWGFGENLRRSLGEEPRGQVALLGAGGAGAAAAYALGRMGAEKVSVLDEDFSRAEALASRLRQAGFAIEARPITERAAVVTAAQGLVQATPVGMTKYPGIPLDPAELHPALWVAEIIYVPVETELLRQARAIGCRTVAGVGMVVLQAARAFEIFTGQTPDSDRMLESFRAVHAG